MGALFVLCRKYELKVCFYGISKSLPEAASSAHNDGTINHGLVNGIHSQIKNIVPALFKTFLLFQNINGLKTSSYGNM